MKTDNTVEPTLEDKLKEMAEFMGHQPVGGAIKTWKNIFNGGTFSGWEYLKYNTDRNWFNEVWVKFRDYGDFKTTKKGWEQYEQHKDYVRKIRTAITDGTLEEAFEELWQGIHWVNSLKK